MDLATMSKIFKTTETIDRILLDSRLFDIKSKDFQLKSVEGVMVYSIVVGPKVSLKSGQMISFNGLDLRRISIFSSPSFSEEKGSISRIEGGLRSFVLDPKKISENAGELNVKFELECEVERVVDDLVRKDHQIESVGEESNRYWLHAQFKELSNLQRLLRRMDLLDIPFIINVAVHQEVKTKFPARRQHELELIAKWARELDRNRKNMLSYQHLQLKSARPREKDITRLLCDLQDIFLPHRFRSFIEVIQDFYYSDCFRGADFYDQIPFRTFPKWMSVLCRTDLSIERPASEGELLYKKASFAEAVEEAITKK